MSMDKVATPAEKMLSFSQGNVEMILKSSHIWAAGVQDISKTFAATAQAQVERTLSTWKALSGVKSLKEAMELQTSLARLSVESAVAETGKVTDASIKLAEQTMAPIVQHITAAFETFAPPSA